MTVDLTAGLDFRLPQYRREVFLRFYEWSIRHRSFPGAVHYVLPHLAEVYGWDIEQRFWAAFLNANTQNPATTLLLMQAAPRPDDADAALALWQRHYRGLEWDTDRRYHKARFEDAVAGYRALTGSGPAAQARYFKLPHEWAAWWQAASAVPTMGRLSTWSYLEYLRVLECGTPDADTLMLTDIPGSRSHRNGLALVAGHEGWISDKQLGTGDDPAYTPDVLGELASVGYGLLCEAQARVPGDRTVGYLSLESALCTYKGWHKPNRRYPGVYNDMLHDRLVRAENRFGRRFGAIWDARREALPARLRLEDNPGDPGCVPVKQNWYLTTGQVIGMADEWPCFVNDFDRLVREGALGRRERAWI